MRQKLKEVLIESFFKSFDDSKDFLKILIFLLKCQNLKRSAKIRKRLKPRAFALLLTWDIRERKKYFSHHSWIELVHETKFEIVSASQLGNIEWPTGDNCVWSNLLSEVIQKVNHLCYQLLSVIILSSETFLVFLWEEKKKT